MAARFDGANANVWPSLLVRLALHAPGLLFGLETLRLMLTHHGRGIGLPVVATALFVLLGVFTSRRLLRPPKADTGSSDVLEACKGDLVVRLGSSRSVIAKEAIVSGFVIPDADGDEVCGGRIVLEGRLGRLVDAWLPRIDDARALLRELGLSPLERPMTQSFFFGLRVTVGVDGVLVAWPLLRRSRFVPHELIDDVRWSADQVRLVLTNGDVYEINTFGSRPGSVEAHRALVERLLSARAAWRASEGTEHPAAALARGGRTLEAWIRDLRALSELGGSRYRSASLPAETLWRIALDPAEEEELRIGAGLTSAALAAARSSASSFRAAAT
jgi:hypothetical protein